MPASRALTPLDSAAWAPGRPGVRRRMVKAGYLPGERAVSTSFTTHPF